MDSLLSPLISSKTRAKLLLRFFTNPKAESYLRALATEFNSSTNSVREELNRLSQAKLISSRKNGREVYYQANQSHPLFSEIASIVKKVLGIDQIIENIIDEFSDLALALLIDDYAEGKDTGVIDLILVGTVDRARLDELVAKTEGFIGRKIRTLCLTDQEYENLKESFDSRPQVVLWQIASDRSEGV